MKKIILAILLISTQLVSTFSQNDEKKSIEIEITSAYNFWSIFCLSSMFVPEPEVYNDPKQYLYYLNRDYYSYLDGKDYGGFDIGISISKYLSKNLKIGLGFNRFIIYRPTNFSIFTGSAVYPLLLKIGLSSGSHIFETGIGISIFQDFKFINNITNPSPTVSVAYGYRIDINHNFATTIYPEILIPMMTNITSESLVSNMQIRFKLGFSYR